MKKNIQAHCKGDKAIVESTARILLKNYANLLTKAEYSLVQYQIHGTISERRSGHYPLKLSQILALVNTVNDRKLTDTI